MNTEQNKRPAAAASAEILNKSENLEQVWRPLPGFPDLEISRLGAVRVLRAVKVDERGMVQVQRGGRRVACSARTLHRAAWPELWPAAAGDPEPVRVVDPSEGWREAVRRRARPGTPDEREEFNRNDDRREKVDEDGRPIRPA